jgi:hypothetical protein
MVRKTLVVKKNLVAASMTHQIMKMTDIKMTVNQIILLVPWTQIPRIVALKRNPVVVQGRVSLMI